MNANVDMVGMDVMQIAMLKLGLPSLIIPCPKRVR